MSKIITHEMFVERMATVNPKIEIVGVYKKSHTPILVRCLICMGEWESQPNSLSRHQGCPYCGYSPRKVLVGINSIWDTHIELAKLLLNPEDGYKYTKCSNKRVDWKCPNCGNIIKNKTIIEVHYYGLPCPKCGDSISYPNKLMFSILSHLDINFETEKIFKWCKYIINNKNMSGRYDFYFTYDNQEYVVEMDGYFHFNDNQMNGQTKENSQKIDIIKDNLAVLHNIIPIRVNCQESNLEYIKKEIIKSKLNNIFNLSIIDWQECERLALSSFKIQACELWEIYHDPKIVAKIMKRSRRTIIRWLKSCTLAGICNYNYTIKRKVYCISTNEVFNSITNASNKYDISGGDITACCKGKRDFAGKLPDGTKLCWKYID